MRIENLYQLGYTYNTTRKSQTVSFDGNKEDLSKLICDVYQKNIPISNDVNKNIVDKFKLSFQEIINQKNLLGKGFFGAVFKIDNNFALKVLDSRFIEPKRLVAEKGKNLFPKLKTYYGEEIMSIGNYSILRNIGKHIPAGINDDIAKNLKYTSKLSNYYINQYLPTFAKVPQKSYDDVAKDFSILNKMKTPDNKFYEVDSVNPSNIVLVKNKLMFVDKIDSTITPYPNTVGILLKMMLNRVVRMFPVRSYGDHVNDARIILRKIIIASEKAKLPYISTVEDSVNINSVFKNCKLDISYDEYIDKIKQIRLSSKNMSKRLTKTEDFLDKVIPISKN